MKILVVCDNYSKGGLETQIDTYYNNMFGNNSMIFAFGNYFKSSLLKEAKIYDGFHFSYNDTINDFCTDVDRLVDIIEKEKIDVIHAHPFYCFFACLFASQITGIKLVYSYHGCGSFNFAKTYISQPLFLYSFECGAVAKVFSVSKNGNNCFNNIGYDNVVLLRNPIDFKKFPIASSVNNNKWLLVSRIDNDKIDEIKLMIKNMRKFNIDKIDIVGDGNELDNLKNFICNNKLDSVVKLKGYSDNIYSDFNNSYTGIIGIGRVILEALAMNIPCILIGFGKITGFVNKNIYDTVKDVNFVNKDIVLFNDLLPTKNDMEYIHSDIVNCYDVNVILKKYFDELENCKSIFMLNFIKLYDEIRNLNNNVELSKCYFHKERFVYNLMDKYVNKFSLRCDINNIFVNANLAYELYDLNTYRINLIKEDKND